MIRLIGKQHSESTMVPQEIDVSPVGWYVGSYVIRFIELEEAGNDDPEREFPVWENTVIVARSRVVSKLSFL